MKNFLKKTLIFLAAVILLVWLVSLNAGKKPKDIGYGVTFSYPYAQNLGLNWKEVYTSMLDDLQIKRIRVPAYWNLVEPEQGNFRFDEIDFQVEEAEKREAGIVLSVGRRLPRWPECHEPEWAKQLSQESRNNALLSQIETVVTRYQNSKAITAWQVENEPFLGSFGECPPLNEELLDQEIALVKKLDPSRPVIISDSGELSSWLNAGSKGDIFGTTLYRYVYSDVLKRYWTNYIPAWFYRFKAGYLRVLHPGKKIVLIELEAEPWTTKGITNTSIQEQFQTMSLKKFTTITALAKRTGFGEQYLWGVEWWYWMRGQGHPEFWEAAKALIHNQ